jgi:hypothetical protein
MGKPYPIPVTLLDVAAKGDVRTYVEKPQETSSGPQTPDHGELVGFGVRGLLDIS